MIRFSAEVGTTQPANRSLLLYRSRQQMEADRQVSRSWRISNATVIRASWGRGGERKRGFQLAAVPVLPTAPFLPSGAGWVCQLFKKSKSFWEKTEGAEESTISLILFSKTPPQTELERSCRAREGLHARGRTRQHLQRLGAWGAHRPGHLRTVSFFLGFCTSRPPTLVGEAGRRPHPRRGLTCALGRCRKARG